jgi:hypothetical protein
MIPGFVYMESGGNYNTMENVTMYIEEKKDIHLGK